MRATGCAAEHGAGRAAPGPQPLAACGCRGGRGGAARASRQRRGAGVLWKGVGVYRARCQAAAGALPSFHLMRLGGRAAGEAWRCRGQPLGAPRNRGQAPRVFVAWRRRAGCCLANPRLLLLQARGGFELCLPICGGGAACRLGRQLQPPLWGRLMAACLVARGISLAQPGASPLAGPCTTQLACTGWPPEPRISRHCWAGAAIAARVLLGLGYMPSVLPGPRALRCSCACPAALPALNSRRALNGPCRHRRDNRMCTAGGRWRASVTENSPTRVGHFINVFGWRGIWTTGRCNRLYLMSGWPLLTLSTRPTDELLRLSSRADAWQPTSAVLQCRQEPPRLSVCLSVCYMLQD